MALRECDHGFSIHSAEIKLLPGYQAVQFTWASRDIWHGSVQVS